MKLFSNVIFNEYIFKDWRKISNFLNCSYIKLFFPLLYFSLKDTDIGGSPVQETETTVLPNNPVYLKKRNTGTFYEDSKKLRLDTVD